MVEAQRRQGLLIELLVEFLTGITVTDQADHSLPTASAGRDRVDRRAGGNHALHELERQGSCDNGQSAIVPQHFIPQSRHKDQKLLSAWTRRLSSLTS